MEDKELFELCHSVYKKTGWDNAYNYQLAHTTIAIPPKEDLPAYEEREGKEFRSDHWTNKKIPIYTSDYILEKLDFTKRNEKLGTKVKQVHLVKEDDSNYRAFCPFVTNVGYADTPLKALLKLTLALHEAGELK